MADIAPGFVHRAFSELPRFEVEIVQIVLWRSAAEDRIPAIQRRGEAKAAAAFSAPLITATQCNGVHASDQIRRSTVHTSEYLPLGGLSSTMSHSAQACLPCKKQKRRCDKALPSCSLCLRTYRDCVYGIESNSPPNAREWASMQARLEALESYCSTVGSPVTHGTSRSMLSQVADSPSPPTFTPSSRSHASTVVSSAKSKEYHNTFPASMFLDIDHYMWSESKPPPPQGDIPPPVLEVLVQKDTILDISHSYFGTVHTWLPILSRKRLDLGLPLRNTGPDLAMLFLAMKLITTIPDQGYDPALYKEAKAFIAQLQNDGTVSLLLLQAMILVAIHEYCHAIYPAAWMTIGACVRYSDLLGLGPKEHTVLGQVTTWTEAEERNRVWWIVFILDQLVALGSKRRPALSTPPPESKLPVDDESWDDGEVTKAISHSAGTPYQTSQSGFARLCQAAMCLNRALEFARARSSPPPAAEVFEFIDELQGLANAIERQGYLSRLNGGTALLAPISLVRTAVLTALDRFVCPEKITAEPGFTMQASAKSEDELAIQTRSMQAIESASQQTHATALEVLNSFEQMNGDESRIRSLSRLSPLMLDAIYASAATFYWLHRESGKATYYSAAADLDRLLAILATRWQLGNAYCEMLKLWDIINSDK